MSSEQSRPAQDYLQCCRELIEKVAAQREQMELAADWFARSILAGRVVHLFGAGHSRIIVEEVWPRYGSFPGFHPIVELSMTFHNQVVGANGQRQAMFLENTPGLAARILRNFKLSTDDSALVISSAKPIVLRVARIIRKGSSCRTAAIWYSTRVRRPETQWCGFPASTRRFRQARQSAAASWPTPSRPKLPPD